MRGLAEQRNRALVRSTKPEHQIEQRALAAPVRPDQPEEGPGFDVVDRTPLLDIKPFVPDFDVPSDADTDWITASESTIESKRADRRFL
ncbi:hypothetical protein C463_10775 [Halorubrum californiense DSM 19288]|uniref:TsaA-like domain-containing protein n=1 Tax=Halorubrum californiense DSM 19288 TaxID=1227465 RepID=M0E6R1_9EURY|nr:hypothetical protein C463_10775 [Halorubrum californiense DSM 19288]